MRPAFKKLYQLRPKMSVSRVSIASRVVNPVHEELRSAIGKESYLCVRRCLLHAYWYSGVRVVKRKRISCIERYVYTKVQQFAGSYFILMYVTLYTTICTHKEVLNDIDNAQLLYHVTI